MQYNPLQALQLKGAKCTSVGKGVFQSIIVLVGGSLTLTFFVPMKYDVVAVIGGDSNASPIIDNEG